MSCPTAAGSRFPWPTTTILASRPRHRMTHGCAVGLKSRRPGEARFTSCIRRMHGGQGQANGTTRAAHPVRGSSLAVAAHFVHLAVQECPFAAGPQDMARFNPKLAHFLALCVKVNAAAASIDCVLVACNRHPEVMHAYRCNCCTVQDKAVTKT